MKGREFLECLNDCQLLQRKLSGGDGESDKGHGVQLLTAACGTTAFEALGVATGRTTEES
jgi:hypothetical protein